MYRRKKRIYNPDAKEPFEISRSKLEMFIQCARCFYLDLRLGVERPSLPAFTLNSAVDILFKKEFDIHRANEKRHPLMEAYGIKAIPFAHPKMDTWRHNFTGVRVFHRPTNFIVFGAVDDIWVTKNKILVVVDYKATSTSRKITLEGKYKEAYKRQMEIYQWLLRGQEDLREKGYRVSNKGFFVYANGKKDEKAFDGRLEFDVQIIPYIGDDSWVEDKIKEAHKCLLRKEIPAPTDDCEYCEYRREADKNENWQTKRNENKI